MLIFLLIIRFLINTFFFNSFLEEKSFRNVIQFVKFILYKNFTKFILYLLKLYAPNMMHFLYKMANVSFSKKNQLKIEFVKRRNFYIINSFFPCCK